MRTSEPIYGLPMTAPDELGLSAARLDRLSQAMNGFVQEGLFAGFITLIARRGKMAHFQCHGMRDMESGQTMQPDTIFRIYSLTKPITSVALMMLYEEGCFQLDEPVSKYIPAFRRLKILSHSATLGIPFDHLEREITFRFKLVVDTVPYGVLISEGSFGWGGAASTDFWVDPEEELIGLLMTQFIPSRLVLVSVREIFENLTYQALVD